MKKCMLLLATLLLLIGSHAEAFDWFGGRLSVGGGVGRVKPKLPYSYQDQYQDGDMWTGNLKYFLNNDFSVIASYADLEPYRRGDHDDFYRFRPIVGSLRYNIFHHLPVTPYITAGAGYSFNNHEIPNTPTIKWKGFTYQAGLGLEFFITEGTSLGAEALYHSFQGEGNMVPYRLISAVGMVNFYFGPGPSQRRTEEALAREKAEAEKAKADAEAARKQAEAAQQQAQSAQQQQASAQQQAEQARQQAQQQIAQAQSEIEQIKQMVARKDISPVNFKSGSADLLVDSHATLDKVAAIGKKYPNLKLRVEGHTDSTGTAEHNQTLSQQRADAVRNYLTSQGGLPADQVTAAGFGQTRPIDSNESPEGRAKNRRVEFVFFLP